MTAKRKAIARKMWAFKRCLESQNIVHCHEADGPDSEGDMVPVLVIPIDPESVEELVETVAAQLFTYEGASLGWSKNFPCGEWRRRLLERSRACLAALGINRRGK